MDTDAQLASVLEQLGQFTETVRSNIVHSELISHNHKTVIENIMGNSSSDVTQEHILKEVLETQKSIEKENVILVSSLVAIERMVHSFDTRGTEPNDAPPLESQIPKLLSTIDDFKALNLLFASYGIDDIEGKGSRTHASPPASPVSQRPAVPATSRSFYNPQKLYVNTGAQTDPEHLLPMDVHDPLCLAFDKVLWVKNATETRAQSSQRKLLVVDPDKTRMHINKPYNHADWESVDNRWAYGTSECGSLQTACDGNFTFKGLTQWLSKPLTGASLHSIEPVVLRNTILTECDPSSPNKTRLSLPMTHISGNAYAMGIILIRDLDLLLFREGAEDKKTLRMPYRTIASIRLGSAHQSVDRTMPPPLTYSIPPSATQFFLMNKIQFSDTYRQFYRTAVIQPLDIGDGQSPAPSSIIFDTETDCLMFINTLDMILNASGRANPHSPFSGTTVPSPKNYLGVDQLTISGRPAIPSVLTDTEAGKRQLAYAKNANLSDLDIFPTHDPLSIAELDFCSYVHIPPRTLSEIKSRILTDPSRHWISALDVATLCSSVNSKCLNIRLTRQILSFLHSQNKIEPNEVVETLPNC